MSRFWSVAGLALRELWISFRLLAMVGLLLLAALPVALIPRPDVEDSWTPLQLFAIGLAVALALIAGLAAATLAAQRRRGTIGWLISRAVPRSVALVAWFGAFALVLGIGMVPAGVLAWLSLGSATAGIAGPAAFILPLMAVWSVGLAAVAAGLLLGALLPALPATAISIVLVAALLLPAATGFVPALGLATAPGAGLAILADLRDVVRPIADSLRAGGMSLTVAAAVLVVGAAALGRADL